MIGSIKRWYNSSKRWVKRNGALLRVAALLWILALVIVASLVGTAGAAQTYVQTFVLCERSAAAEMFATFRDRSVTREEVGDLVQAERCIAGTPTAFQIDQAVESYHKDFEGDWMVLVRVAVTGRYAYAIAWPGGNSNYPSPASI